MLKIRHTPWILTLTAIAACSEGDTACVDGFPCKGDAEVPATGLLSDVDAWLAGGAYLNWACEAGPTAATGSSPHGRHRTCSNAKLSTATGNEYPVGSANVKELYDDGKVEGYAVMLKVRPGVGGDKWYWFERVPGGNYPANGIEDDTCTGCHAGAPKDSVFTQVMRK